VCRRFTPLPQILKNVRVSGEVDLENGAIADGMRDAEARLGNKGRILLRPSGTEPVIRVMAEGEDEAMVTAIVDRLCAIIEASAVK